MNGDNYCSQCGCWYSGGHLCPGPKREPVIYTAHTDSRDSLRRRLEELEKEASAIRSRLGEK